MQSESMGEPKDLRDFEHGEYVASDIFGPSDGWRVQLHFYPCRSAFGHVEAYVQMFPPCGCEEQSWTCEQADWQIVLKEEGNFTGCIMESRTDFESKDGGDCRGGEFSPEYTIDFDRKPELTLNVRAKMMVPASADMAASLLSNVDFTQQLTQVTFRLSTGPCLFLDKRVLMARSEAHGAEAQRRTDERGGFEQRFHHQLQGHDSLAAFHHVGHLRSPRGPW